MASVVPTPPVLQFPDTLGIFRYFCQSVLPAVYDDSLSYYEVVCKVAEQLNKTMEATDSVNSDLQQLYDFVVQLQLVMEQFMEDGFDDYYKNQVAQWMADNLKWIFDHLIRNVYFGLTQDGYFCAYIPASWAWVQFDTIMDYSDPNYGHLVLKY